MLALIQLDCEFIHEQCRLLTAKKKQLKTFGSSCYLIVFSQTALFDTILLAVCNKDLKLIPIFDVGPGVMFAIQTASDPFL